MSTKKQTRRSFASSTTSWMAKRRASSSSSMSVSVCVESVGKVGKKRTPLGDVTNRSHNNLNANAASYKSSRTTSVPSSSLHKAPCSTKFVKVKKGPPASITTKTFSGSILPPSLSAKSSLAVACKATPTIRRSNDSVGNFASAPALCHMDISPTKSDSASISVDETMSTCDSFKSPQVEYIDNNDIPAIDSINKKTNSHLYISDHLTPAGIVCKRDTCVDLETDDKVANVDDNSEDPQLCATIAYDIYKHLRASELKKRPSTDFMEGVQKDINASMRAILVDWLVEVAEEYRLVPDTLYLTVNYIDRYLSGNVMNRQRLQLLGVACMMIAAKYEEICAPQVEEFCYITDNTYFREEVLEMESSVLNYLKFEMTAPTAKCFLRRFVRAALVIDEVPSMQFECLANYITELSLLEYDMLCYAPSLIAASAIFLAKFILLPLKRPWNATLQHYTLYRPSDLIDSVKDLHRLCCGSHSSTLPAIREKYCQHKYKFVAKKYCPPSIPQDFFHNQL